jgi:hypothetical protein
MLTTVGQTARAMSRDVLSKPIARVVARTGQGWSLPRIKAHLALRSSYRAVTMMVMDAAGGGVGGRSPPRKKLSIITRLSYHSNAGCHSEQSEETRR